MKKKIKLEGLCCANCAAQIEERVRKISGINTCVVNFITEKMIVEASDENAFIGLYPAIEQAVHKIEPDVHISIC